MAAGQYTSVQLLPPAPMNPSVLWYKNTAYTPNADGSFTVPNMSWVAVAGYLANNWILEAFTQ